MNIQSQNAGTPGPDHAGNHTDQPKTARHEVHDWSDGRELNEKIAQAAYFKAERRGFAMGEEEIDWLEAEQELLAQMEGEHMAEDRD